VARVARARSQLAMDMKEHPDERIRELWEGMWTRRFVSDTSGRESLGGGRNEHEERQETGREDDCRGGMMHNTWLTSLDDLLRDQEITWHGAWSPIPLREGDHNLVQHMGAALNAGNLGRADAKAIRQGLQERDVAWLSQLALSDGVTIPDWQVCGGVWGGVAGGG
jgi:hypothetical protein